MNLYSLLYSIKAIKETLDRAQKAESNYLDEQGNHNLPYAYGRYCGTVKGMTRSVEMLVEQMPEIEKLKEVISIFRLDDPAVVNRIIAMKRQGLFEEEVIELMESHDLLADPEPEPEEDEEDED